jgi:hypothetical protein
MYYYYYIVKFSGREEMCVLIGALRDGGARWGVLRGDGTTPTGELLTKHTHIVKFSLTPPCTFPCSPAGCGSQSIQPLLEGPTMQMFSLLFA